MNSTRSTRTRTALCLLVLISLLHVQVNAFVTKSSPPQAHCTSSPRTTLPPSISPLSVSTTTTRRSTTVQFSSVPTTTSSNTSDVIQAITSLSTSNEDATPSTYNPTLGKKRLASGMAFCTGWADLAMFSQWKTFGSMMTGNTMWCAKACVEQRWVDVLYYITVILSYWTGLAIFRVSQTSSAPDESTSTLTSTPSAHLRRMARRVATVFGLAGLLVVRSATAKSLLGRTTMTMAVGKWIPALLVASGFGMANAVGSDTASTMTFVVTGHMTTLVNTITDLFVAEKDANKERNPDNNNNNNKSTLLRRFWKTPGVVMSTSVTASFFVGVLWASALSLLKTRLARTGSATAMAWITSTWGVDFGLMGLVLGGLLLWKDWKSKQPETSSV